MLQAQTLPNIWFCIAGKFRDKLGNVTDAFFLPYERLSRIL